MAAKTGKATGTVPDILDLDLSKDGDACNQKELDNLYQQSYYCASRKAIGLEKLFILHLDCEWTTNKLVSAQSNYSVHIASSDTLQKISTHIAHNQNIIDVHFSPTDPNCFYTAASDGTIRCWDVRDPLKHTQEYIDEENRKRPLMSFDVNCQGRFLCAGTEQVKEDAFLMFWDVRSNSLLGGYWESHEDDISHVQFHRTKPDMLATCSTDCLINIFDISESNEDDALQFSLNTETSCGRLEWLSEVKKQQRISVITHTEDIQIWDIEEAVMQQSFSRESLKTALKRKQAETCYNVRCFNIGSDEGPLVLAGSSTPSRECLRLLKFKEGQLEPYAVLYDKSGSNAQTVRCAAFNSATGQLVSGGEDGIINVWMPGQEQPVTTGKAMIEIPTKKASKGRAKKPYNK